jgi:hypothetical protein
MAYTLKEAGEKIEVAARRLADELDIPYEQALQGVVHAIISVPTHPDLSEWTKKLNKGPPDVER